MSADLILDDDELEELKRIGRPQDGDDAQLVSFRTMVRAMVQMVKSQRDVVGRLKKVEEATVKCEETNMMVTKLVKALTPDDAKRHIDVRVDRLEKLSTGAGAILKSNAAAIIIALLYGAAHFLKMV